MFTKSVTGSGFAPQAYAYSIIPALYLKFYDIYIQVLIQNPYLLQIHILFQSIDIYPANMKNRHVQSRLFGKDVYI